MRYLLFFLFLIICPMIKANNVNDSIKYLELEIKQQILEDKLNEVRRDQLNYSIEKDIYKDVYKNNYDRINITITFVLGLFGVLGFLGIRNINSIQKDYNKELNELVSLRKGFETRIKEFNSLKEKYDSELDRLRKTNNDQNIKIKLLELKEKINTKIESKEYNMALETALVGLELAPDDFSLLRSIAIIYCRLGSYQDSIRMLRKAMEVNPKDKNMIADLVEFYYFNNQVDSAKKIMESNEDWIGSDRKEKLLNYLNIINIYHNGSSAELRDAINNQIDKSDLNNKRKRFEWNFEDVHLFHAHVKYPQKESLLIRYIWYLKGDYTGQQVLDEIKV